MEIFLRISLDAKTQQPVVTYSKRGGMDLERITNLYPTDIHKIHIDFIQGIQYMDLLKVSYNLGFTNRSYKSKLASLINNCYKCYVQRDCQEVLINPLVLTKENNFRAPNPRLCIDDNAYYRQSEMLDLDDST